MTNLADRRLLLKLARDTIAAHLGLAAVPAPRAPVLERLSGAFVTIHRHGELRGCIGHIEATQSLGEVIPSCAVAACSRDPRFRPVSPAELSDLDLELSLLGELEAVSSPDDFDIGRHGLLVERREFRGLLLPQVAVEHGWDRVTFLGETCRKAGLPRDAWQHGARIWRFDAEVFGEPEP